MKFTSKEIDPTTGEPDADGFEDEYEVEELELTGSDYVLPAYAGSFDHVWEHVGANGEEASETLQLSSVKSISGTSTRATVTTLADRQQMLLSNCPRRFRCSHWMAPT